MAFKLYAPAIDYGLDAFNSDANKIMLCDAEPTDYADANSHVIGAKDFGAGAAFGNPEDYASGRKIASNPVTDGSVTADGTPACWAVVDDANSRLLASGPLSGAAALVSGMAFSLASFVIDLPRSETVQGPTVTWDSAHMSTQGQLSNGDLDFAVAVIGNWRGVLATLGQSSGKRYLEMIPVGSVIAYHEFGVALITAAVDDSDFLGQSVDCCGVDARAQSAYARGSFTSNITTTPALSVNDVVGIAIDLDAGKVWFARNNSYTAYLTGSDPATAANPAFTFSNPGITLYPMANCYNDYTSNIARLAASGIFTYSPPSGFVAWNSGA